MKKTDNILQTIQRKFAGNKRISNSLITLSSAAILGIYAAGYEQTKAAADRFTEQSAERLANAPASPVFAQVEPAPTLESLDRGQTTAAVAGVPASNPAALARGVTVAAPDSSSSLIASNSNGLSNATTEPASAPAESPVLAIAKLEIAPVNEPAVGSEPRAVEPPAAVTAPVPVPAPTPVTRQSQYKDGTYQGWGSSRHGDIQVSVVIQDGRIASAAIAQCLTRYPCSWISQLPGQVTSRQSPTVDYVSGATQSVNAYYGAVVEALSKAK